jgi:signal transduction histidine kinase
MRGSGLDVALEQRGEPIPLPAAQQLAIYRITQEALTNALRHGDTSEQVQASIDWAADTVTLTISNATAETPPSTPPAGTPSESAEGHGLPGMRERAILAGGTFDAAPRGEHFVVTARIPVHP